MEVLTWIQTHWIEIVAAVGGTVLVARIIVKLTPSPRDDTVLDAIVEFLKTIGLHVNDKK